MFTFAISFECTCIICLLCGALVLHALSCLFYENGCLDYYFLCFSFLVLFDIFRIQEELGKSNVYPNRTLDRILRGLFRLITY